jgi:hypothetical protein
MRRTERLGNELERLGIPRAQNFGHLNKTRRMANRRSYQDGEDNRQTVSGDKRGSSNSTAVLKRTAHLIYSITRYTAHIT